MKRKVSNLDMNPAHAKALAVAVAKLVEDEPVVRSWYDKQHKMMAPDIEGADIKTRWKDYGEAYGGNLNVSVNGDFDFIFSDSSKFETGDQRLANLKDEQDNEYLMCDRILHPG